MKLARIGDAISSLIGGLEPEYGKGQPFALSYYQPEVVDGEFVDGEDEDNPRPQIGPEGWSAEGALAELGKGIPFDEYQQAQSAYSSRLAQIRALQIEHHNKMIQGPLRAVYKGGKRHHANSRHHNNYMAALGNYRDSYNPVTNLYDQEFAATLGHIGGMRDG